MPDPKHVLVIDDDDFVRATICEVVADYGFRVTHASDGMRGLAALQGGERPGIVITDIIMPGKSGLEVIAEIRKNFPEIKIIAISGGGGAKGIDNLAAAKSLGSHWIIPKPVDIKELEKALMQLSS